MKLTLLAVGRLKTGPERTLLDTYLNRCEQVGRGIGFKAVEEREIADRAPSSAEERLALLAALPDGSHVIGLDERGKSLTSIQFADVLGTLRDQGVAEMVLVIGGADGLGDGVRQRANRLLAFGPMTWPHKLARVMAAEQLYRAVSILSGSPYHREG